MTGAVARLALPEPPLRAGPIRLRPWRAADAAELVAAWTDPEIARWTGVPDVVDQEVASRWIERTSDLRARNRSLDLVIDLADEVVGEVGLVPMGTAGTGTVRFEVGWWVAAPHRGRGLASAAVRCFVDWALGPLGPGVGEVVAVCATANPASGRVAAAAGFSATDLPVPPGHVLWRRAAPPGRPGTVHP